MYVPHFLAICSIGGSALLPRPLRAVSRLPVDLQCFCRSQGLHADWADESLEDEMEGVEEGSIALHRRGRGDLDLQPCIGGGTDLYRGL